MLHISYLLKGHGFIFGLQLCKEFWVFCFTALSSVLAKTFWQEEKKTQLRSDMNIQYSVSLHVAAEYSIEYYINYLH